MSEPTPRHDPFGFGWPNVISVIRILLIPVVALLIVRDTAAARWVATPCRRKRSGALSQTAERSKKSKVRARLASA